MLTDDELRAAYDGADQSTAGWHILGLRAVADAVLAKAIPPGFVVVPAEPTKAMLAAGVAAESNAPTHVQERLTLLAYRAMLAAAPPPPAAEPSEAQVEAAWEVLYGTTLNSEDGKRVRAALRAAAAARGR